MILSGQTLFGTTYAGGMFAKGTVFRMNTDGTQFQVIHSFAGGPNDGQTTSNRVALSGETLYGTTFNAT
jgi:uncharacterized repeat protein (TIGR03803 family)